MTAMTSAPVRLPGGVQDDAGRWHRAAEVVPLRGRDEELLAGTSRPAAELVTAVLAGCVPRIGAIAPVTEAVARALTVGDRQFLLLKLRELTFGPDVAAVVSCPARSCGKRMDVGFRIPDVPVRRAGHDGGSPHEVELSPGAVPADEAGAGRRVRFRLPTGADQEALAHLVDENPAEALRRLLERCLVGIAPDRVEALSPLARLEIERAMAAAAHGPELTMQASCPECAHAFPLYFEPADFFFGEVDAAADLLERDIHRLAFHYHWSEAEILGLPVERRRRYIEVLEREIGGLGDALD